MKGAAMIKKLSELSARTKLILLIGAIAVVVLAIVLPLTLIGGDSKNRAAAERFTTFAYGMLTGDTDAQFHNYDCFDPGKYGRANPHGEGKLYSCTVYDDPDAPILGSCDVVIGDGHKVLEAGGETECDINESSGSSGHYTLREILEQYDDQQDDG
jgi:hypothetical protein